MTIKTTSQKVTTWRPTVKQAAVLEEARYGQFWTVTAICRNAGVSRKSIYAWLNHDPNFIAVWNALWKESAQKSMPLIVAAMVRKAVRGDVAAARLISEIAEATRSNDNAALQNLTFNVTMIPRSGGDANG